MIKSQKSEDGSRELGVGISYSDSRSRPIQGTLVPYCLTRNFVVFMAENKFEIRISKNETDKRRLRIRISNFSMTQTRGNT